MTAHPVIASFEPFPPPPRAEAALSAVSTVSLAITDLQVRYDISYRLASAILALSPLAVIRTILQHRRHLHRWARRRVQLP